MSRMPNFARLKKIAAKRDEERNRTTTTGPKQATLSRFFSKTASEISFDRLVKNQNKETGTTNGLHSTNQALAKGDFSTTTKCSSQETSGRPSNGTIQKLRQFSANADQQNTWSTNSTPVKRSLGTTSVNFRNEEQIPEVCDVESEDEQTRVSSAKRPNLRRGTGKDTSLSCKYTPLELQFLEIKKKHEDAILFIECGYKYRFFGEDAEIAAKELNIIAHLDHNFQTASIPTHRLFVHVRRLVAKGFKVGVVKQTETAALKAAGDNHRGPFSRQLTALYTKSTIIGEDVDPVSGASILAQASSESNATSYLVCLCESMRKKQKSGNVTFGLVAVHLSSGDMIYDSFDDFPTRYELETRLAHLQPIEMLIPKSSLTTPTEVLIKHVSNTSSTVDDRLRLERMDDTTFEYSAALCVVTKFYETHVSSEDERHDVLNKVLNLPPEVLSCLAALIVYLQDFKLDRILALSHNMTKFTLESQYLKLNATALHNLEIFRNATDGKLTGTLYHAVNQTQTQFGSRLLKKWLSHPLRDIKEIEDRLEVVTELVTSNSAAVVHLKTLLAKVPDLEKGLGTIFHLKCGTWAFLTTVKALSAVHNNLQSLRELIDSQLQTSNLKNMLLQIMEDLHDIDGFVKNISESAAKEGDKTKILIDVSEFPAVVTTKQKIVDILGKLKELKGSIRQTLRVPGFDYVTVSGQEFLMEVRNAQLKAVPKEWIKINSTKLVVRFRSPEVESLVQQLTQWREQLLLDCTLAWNTFLLKFNENFHRYSKMVRNLARLDCFLSLAKVAQQAGYCRPYFVQHSTIIQIEGGRHPVLQTLLSETTQFVPNGTDLDVEKKSCMIITGPNMGGKSSYIRQVALIVLMAQIGSYVPAEVATLGIFDAIYTRMGASDEMYHGRSTFMVELQETSEIIRYATSQSLVILDELGRGTSTHDGVAIAHAALNYFLTEVKCLTMFVTHYTTLTEFDQLFPDRVGNYHMGFLVHEPGDDKKETEVVTFMYQLTEGVAARSYGLNVARLADIPDDVVQLATQKSHQLEEDTLKKKHLQGEFFEVWTAKEILVINEAS